MYVLNLLVDASLRGTLSITVPHAKTGKRTTHRATACTRTKASKKTTKANMTSMAKLTEATSRTSAAPRHVEEEEVKR